MPPDKHRLGLALASATNKYGFFVLPGSKGTGRTQNDKNGVLVFDQLNLFRISYFLPSYNKITNTSDSLPMLIIGVRF